MALRRMLAGGTQTRRLETLIRSIVGSCTFRQPPRLLIDTVDLASGPLVWGGSGTEST